MTGEPARVHRWGSDLESAEPGPPAMDAGDMQALAALVNIETAEQIKESLGIGVPRVRCQPPDHPDVSELREGMGI